MTSVPVEEYEALQCHNADLQVCGFFCKRLFSLVLVIFLPRVLILQLTILIFERCTRLRDVCFLRLAPRHWLILNVRSPRNRINCSSCLLTLKHYVQIVQRATVHIHITLSPVCLKRAVRCANSISHPQALDSIHPWECSKKWSNMKWASALFLIHNTSAIEFFASRMIPSREIGRIILDGIEEDLFFHCIHKACAPWRGNTW